MIAPSIRLWTVDLDAIGSGSIAPAQTATTRRQARQLALEQVAEQAGVQIVRSCPICGLDGHGRPMVRDGNVDISVTWVGRWGLIALADCRLGIDAELLRVAPKPVTSALSPSEVAALATLSGRDRTHNFLRLWTAKEAVAKADGRGLTLPLPLLDVAPVIPHGQTTVAVDGTNWHVVVLDHTFPDGEEAAFAIATGSKRVNIIWSSRGRS